MIVVNDGLTDGEKRKILSPLAPNDGNPFNHEEVGKAVAGYLDENWQSLFSHTIDLIDQNPGGKRGNGI